MPKRPQKHRSNDLFNYLNDLIQNSRLTAFEANRKTSREGIPYIMLPLQATFNKLLIDDQIYQVTEQHISIFANVTAYSHHSPYHFTAHLQAENKTTFKLHVYFDQNDKVIGHISLKECLTTATDNEKVTYIKSDTASMLSAWAQAEATPCMTKLMQQRNHTLNSLISRLETALIALSDEYHLLDSKDEAVLNSLQAKTADLRKKAKAIAFIDSQFTHPLLEELEKNIEWDLAYLQHARYQQQQEKTPEQVHHSSKIQMTLSPTKSGKKSAHKAQTKTPKHRQEKARITQEIKAVDKDLRELVALGDTLKHAGLDKGKQSELAFALYQQSLNFLLILAETQHPQKAACSFQAQRLQMEASTLCQALLNDALTCDDKHVITQLKTFLGHSPDKHLQYAIDQNDEQMIHDVLTNSDLAINRIRLKVDSDTEKHPLIYAFQQNKFEAFRALVEEGCNLLVPYEDELPLLHTLLSSEFEEYFNYVTRKLTMLELKLFSRQLIFSLESYLDRHPALSEEVRKNIELSINRYTLTQTCTTTIKELISGSEKHYALVNTQGASLQNEILTSIPSDVRNSLVNDPTFLQLLNKYVEAMNSFFQQLDPRERQQLLRFGKKHVEQIFSSNTETAAKLLEHKGLLYEVFKQQIEAFQLLAMQRSLENQRKKTKNKSVRKTIDVQLAAIAPSMRAIGEQFMLNMEMNEESASQELEAITELGKLYDLFEECKAKIEAFETKRASWEQAPLEADSESEDEEAAPTFKQ